MTVTATDPGGLSAEQSFTVTVPNRAPEVSDSIPDAEVFVGETVDVDLSGRFADPDGDDLSYEAASSNWGGVAKAYVSGASLTVAAVGAGTATITVTAADQSGLSVDDVFEVTASDSVRERLEAFYDVGNGDGWRLNGCWKRCDDLNHWYGVGYHGVPRLFLSLQMDRNKVSGTVLPLLGEPPTLRSSPSSPTTSPEASPPSWAT